MTLFKALPIVATVYREETLPPPARGYARDAIALGWEERLKARARRRSRGGVEFGTSLPRGTVLRDGDRLVLDTQALVVDVEERLEAAFVIAPRSAPWARRAYLARTPLV